MTPDSRMINLFLFVKHLTVRVSCGGAERGPGLEAGKTRSQKKA